MVKSLCIGRWSFVATQQCLLIKEAITVDLKGEGGRQMEVWGSIGKKISSLGKANDMSLAEPVLMF